MSQHLSPELADRYRRRTLAKPELIAADQHLASCQACRQLLADEDTVSRQIDSLRTDLRASLELGHPEYIQLEAYVDQKLAAEEREALDLHFKSCQLCAEELRDLQSFKAQLDEAQPVKPKNLGTAAPSSLLSRLFLPLH